MPVKLFENNRVRFSQLGIILDRDVSKGDCTRCLSIAALLYADLYKIDLCDRCGGAGNHWTRTGRQEIVMSINRQGSQWSNCLVFRSTQTLDSALETLKNQNLLRSVSNSVRGCDLCSKSSTVQYLLGRVHSYMGKANELGK